MPLAGSTPPGPERHGSFLESYRRSAFAELGIEDDFVQGSHSALATGIVRGMHFQPGTARLVLCVRGQIFDVLDYAEVAIEWPSGVELVASERDRGAPRLDEIEASLPFVDAASVEVDARTLD